MEVVELDAQLLNGSTMLTSGSGKMAWVPCVCGLLAVAHMNGTVHRSLCPSTVLMHVHAHG